MGDPVLGGVEVHLGDLVGEEEEERERKVEVE